MFQENLKDIYSKDNYPKTTNITNSLIKYNTETSLKNNTPIYIKRIVKKMFKRAFWNTHSKII